MATRKIGAPELPKAMRRIEALDGVLATRTLNSATHWSGITQQQLVDMFNESSPRVAGILEILSKADLLTAVPVWVLRGGELVSGEEPEATEEVVRQFHMYYGSDESAIYVARRDGVKLARVRARFREDIRGDHNEVRPKRRHTLQFNDCVVALTRGKYDISAGYRGCVYLPGAQAVPDARMLARISLGEYLTEFVKGLPLTETGPMARAVRSEVRSMLGKYLPVSDELGRLLVLCQSEVTVGIVREEAKAFGIPVIAKTINRVVVEPPLEDEAVIARELLVDRDIFVEYERSAKTPVEIRDKLMVYFRLALREKEEGELTAIGEHDLIVMVISETHEAMLIFREEHQNLARELKVSFPLFTATYAEVTAGKKVGDNWNLNGENMKLSSAVACKN